MCKRQQQQNSVEKTRKKFLAELQVEKELGSLPDYLEENPKGLDTLAESIRREKTHNFLIQKITDEVLKLWNIKLERLTGRKCSICEPFAARVTNNLARSSSDESDFSEKERPLSCTTRKGTQHRSLPPQSSQGHL